MTLPKLALHTILKETLTLCNLQTISKQHNIDSPLQQDTGGHLYTITRETFNTLQSPNDLQTVQILTSQNAMQTTPATTEARM